MNPNRRSTTRPYVRRRSSQPESVHGAASRLSSLAGRAARPDIEPLEPRQLLFSLTVDPSTVDPTTGVGFAEAFVGYTVPLLQFPDQIDIEPDEVVEEDFDDEGGGGTRIISQTAFDESNLLVRHNISPASDFTLVDEPGTDPEDDEARVQALLQEGEQFSFSPLGVEDRTDLLRAMRAFQIEFFATAGSPQGLDLENTRVTLLFNGEELASFEGRSELQAFRTGGGGPMDGIGTFRFVAPRDTPGAARPAFDTIRFESVGGPSDAFQFDNVSFDLPPGNFADLTDGRIFGAWIRLAGTAGTTAEFFDVNGDPMRQTIALGIPDGAEVPIVDSNDDGVPEFNEGIGRIELSSTDAATTLTIFGGIVEQSDPDPDVDFVEGDFVFTIVDNTFGLTDEFEDAGFGFRPTPDGMGEVDGLAPAGGSVVIGSPIVRDNSSQAAYNPQGQQLPGSFVDPNQGIFALGGASVGTITIHGMVFGSSVFDGAVDTLSFSSLLGSVTVKGDLGALNVQSDAGLWVGDDANAITKTGSQLIVERTLGQVNIGGRSLMDTTVVGDLSAPAVRPARDIVTYFELESPQRLTSDNTDVQDTLRQVIGLSTIGQSVRANSDTIGGGFGLTVSPLLGGQFLRNDSVATAEFVGSTTSQVQIIGDIDFGDPVNTAEDGVDVFGVPLDGSRPIVIEGVTFDPTFEIRLVDARGRQVAAAEADEQFINTGRYFLEYTPEQAGVFYIVLSADSDGSLTGGATYALNVSGLAPVTLGSYRSASGMGSPAVGFAQGVPTTSGSVSLTVLSGATGTIRSGTAIFSSGGGEISADEGINFSDEDAGVDDPPDQRANLRGGSFSLAGDLFELYAGSDIETTGEPLTMTVGGDLHAIITGQSPVLGTGPLEGDLFAQTPITFNVGGGIGFVDVSGGIGIDQDIDTNPPPAVGTFGSITFNTGTAGGRGDIGFIRVGSHVGADTLSVITSPGSVVGGFAVSQDIDFAITDQIFGIDGFAVQGSEGVNFQLGAGSDLRFLDTPNLATSRAENAGIELLVREEVEFIDDGGGRFTVRVDGPGVDGTPVGFLRFVGVDGSQGVALATIEVDLTGGRNLRILAQGGSPEDVISIGRIDVQGASAQSQIEIDGNVQIDVWQILQTGGGAFNSISNQTPGGDIVAIDVAGINDVEVFGDLGRTQVPDIGPRRISPFVGVNGSVVQGIGRDTTFTVPAGIVDDDFNGQLFRPVGDNNFDAGNAFLSDVGSPVDPYLDGLFVRGGNVNEVRVDGSLGDVILAPGATITRISVNDDDATGAGGFDGIFGTIYAGDILEVDVGDGVLAPAQNSISTTGIFATDDIVEVIANDAVIASNIVAANSVIEGPQDGIEDITLSNTLVTDAFIGATNIDRFWLSLNYGDDFFFFGNIESVQGTQDTRIFRSRIAAGFIERIDLAGDLDASQVEVTTDLETLVAANIINSTNGGTPRELFQSFVSVDGDVERITIGGTGAGASGEDGVLSDTLLDIAGEIEQGFTARLIQRSDIQVNGTIRNMSADDIRSTNLSTGQLTSLDVADAIRSSSFSVSGPLLSLIAREITGTELSVTGPDGRLDLLQVATLFDGSILSTGPIQTIEATAGDLRGRLETRTARGDVSNLTASRDILLETDISGRLDNIDVGRNLGDIDNPGVVLVRGDLNGADISGGGLYSDIRVGDAITGEVVIGQLPGLPSNNQIPTGSIEAFGRIDSVVVNGDYAGSVVSYSGGIGSVTINDGSLLPQGSVEAFNGNVGTLTINNGHLLGDVHADQTIFFIRLNGSEDGVFGDIGVNPALSSAAAALPLRNQLPPGVGASSAVDGPRITAGKDIGSVVLTNGSIFESVFFAHDAIGTISVAGDLGSQVGPANQGSQFVAGNSIFRIEATGSASEVLVAAGVFDLGADGRAGGVGADADAVKSGRVRSVSVQGDATNVSVSAGIVAGADGLYNTGDDLHALGVSVVEDVFVGGAVTSVSAHADTGLPTRSAGITTGGQATPVVGDQLLRLGFTPDQSAFDFASLGEVVASGGSLEFTRGSATGTISLSGPGRAVWDAAQGRLLLIGTTIASDVTVTSSTGALEDFDIITNDDASVGRLDVRAIVFGDSDLVVDGFAREVLYDGFFGTGSITVGNDVQLLEMRGSPTGPGSLLTSGEVRAVFVRQLTVAADLGGESPQQAGDFVTPTVTIFGTEGITVGGSMRAVVSVDNGVRGDVFVNGSINNSALRSGRGIGSVTAFDVSRSVVSAGDAIGSVAITGNVFDTSFIGGGDLGRDARPGGTGLAADSTNGGSVGEVSVGGDFRQSDVVAGLLAGPDGFFGSSDDVVSGGRSSIASVRIAGDEVGSNRGSESFGVLATGEIGEVTLDGGTVESVGNFAVAVQDTLPGVVQVEDIVVRFDGGVHIADVVFNQAMNADTVRRGLLVSEVRQGGSSLVRLDEGLDYLFEYDAEEQKAILTFRRSVTDASLPQLPGEPGAGLFRFELDPDIVRGQNVAAGLDADGDGFADSDRFFSADAFVGDVGDKVTPNSVTVDRGIQGPGVIDFFGPGSLDVALDNNFQPDSLPDTNRSFTLRGFIGDHPDTDAQAFSSASDIDVFTLTLQAGQILRLGPNLGSAFNAQVLLVAPDGTPQLGVNAASTTLPADRASLLEGVTTFGNDFLITQTGTFFLAITNSGVNPIFDPDSVVDVLPASGLVGNYEFSIEVFDDGDSGFSASTNSGDGRRLVEAPDAQSFAGVDGQLGTADDRGSITVGAFTFTVDPATGVVTGTDGAGVVSTRTPDGVSTQTVASAIGKPGARGLPGAFEADVDVFHLNNRRAIQAGDELRLTVRLSETGADLGGRRSTGTLDTIIDDFSGSVQFGLFNTSQSTGVGDAELVFSPTDFATSAAAGAQSFTQGDILRSGTDENGDFFIVVQAPETATYAAYIQGVFNADYELEIQRTSTAPDTDTFAGADGIFGTFDDLQSIVQGRFRYTLDEGPDGDRGTQDDSVDGAIITQSQNVLIEFGGGTIDWLEVGGQTTDLLPFNTQALGFNGTIDDTPVDVFIRQQVVQGLNDIFQGSGFDVTFSDRAGDFGGEDFSTVFVTDTADPVNFTFSADPLGFFFNPFSFGVGNFGLGFERIFGYSERSDAFNTDPSDEAVVFVPQLTALGFNPTPGEVVDLTESLNAAIGRRVGELLGLRTTANTFASPAVDVMAANSPGTLPTGDGSFVLPGALRPLSTDFDDLADTDFFLGGQSSAGLLDLIVSRR